MKHRTTAAVILAATAATAHADIVEMHFTGKGQGQNVRLEMGDRSINTFAGQLLHEVTGATGAGEQLLGINAYFCTDLFQYATARSTEYTITALTEVPDSKPMSAPAAGAIRNIFAYAGGEQLDLDAPDPFAAAFQLAVWEIVSDYDEDIGRSSMDVEHGWFRAKASKSASLGPEVRGYLDDLFDAVGSGDDYGVGVMAFRSSTSQDQLRTIPAPGSTAAFAAGLLVMIGRRRR